MIYLPLILLIPNLGEDDIEDNLPLSTIFKRSPVEAFQQFTSNLWNVDCTQELNLKRGSLLLHCVRLMKQKRLDLMSVPDVRFEGEEGIDAEGLTREFLTGLMTSIRQGEGSLTLFEGQYPNVVPCHNTDYLSSRIFFYVGQLMAYSIVHSGIAMTGLSPAAASFIINANIDMACDLLTLQDVADLELRDVIDKVSTYIKLLCKIRKYIKLLN